MSTVPKGRADRLAYYERHVDRWVQNAEAMGLPADYVAALQSKTIEARQAFNQQHQAQQAARAATSRFNDAVRELRKLGANVRLMIGASAANLGPGIYALASISPPKRKSPIGPPGQPYGFRFSLSQVGTLKLTWKCKNPKGAEGTAYYVFRRIGSTGEMTFQGIAGTKRFIDKTLPRGAASVTYQIQAMRSTRKGEAGQFIISFGTGNTKPVRASLPSLVSA